jgi:AefR-like transcriptional repressor, C-terminal domain
MVLLPEAVQLRRLMIGEAGRLPDLAGEYYDRVPQRVIAALAGQLQRLAERGVLRVENPLAGPTISTIWPTRRWMSSWRRTVQIQEHDLC